MTMDRSPRADRVLVGLMDELADARTPAYLEAAIERASSRSQRPTWTFPERWFPMADLASRRALAPRLPWRAIAVALVILALLIAGAVFVGSRQTHLPPPFGLARNGLFAYASNGDIYTIDPRTSAKTTLVAGPADEELPAWSRDGTRLAFIRQTGSVDTHPNGSLFVVGAGGGKPVEITSEPFVALTWYEFSADGRSIAFSSEIDGHPEITIAATDGSGTRTLDLSAGLPPGFYPDAPAFRPVAGKEILFTASSATRSGVYLVDVDGANLRTLVEPQADGVLFYYATWSSDGSRIAYTRVEGDDWEAHVLSLDDSVDITLQSPGALSQGWPAWSPDGSHLVIERIRADGSSAYAVVPSDGSRSGIEIQGDQGTASAYAWAPDGSVIIAIPDVNPTQQVMWDPVSGASTDAPWTSGSYPAWQRIAP